MSNTRQSIQTFMATLRALADDPLLGRIEQAEMAYNSFAAQMHGFVALSRAFKSFLLSTVNLSASWSTSRALTETHAWLLPRMSGSFHTICGAETSALRGYPGPAFALLRNVFDTAIVTSAVAQGFVTFMEAEGLVRGEAFDAVQIARRRKRCEFDIHERMLAKASGLGDVARHELEKLNKLYDFETHGQRMTATAAMAWMRGEKPLNFLPHYNQMNYALFMNRFCEVSWMYHRLVPLMLPSDVPVGGNWSDRWSKLDACFCQVVAAMTVDLGKAVGDAVVELITKKFPFGADSRLLQ